MTSLLFVYKIQYKLAYTLGQNPHETRCTKIHLKISYRPYISLEIQVVVKRWTNIPTLGWAKEGRPYARVKRKVTSRRRNVIEVLPSHYEKVSSTRKWSLDFFILFGNTNTKSVFHVSSSSSSSRDFTIIMRSPEWL